MPAHAEMSDAAYRQARAKRKGQSSTPVVAKRLHVRQRFDLDPDTLECPICSEPFSPPVYQCENGHPTCSLCCEKISRCPSCSQPTGRIRNRAIEKVIESLQVECKHAGHGCNTMVKYTEKANHEKDLCEYRPILCPVIRLMLENSGEDCTYIGPQASIPGHLADAHGVRIVECAGSMRSTSFTMKVSEDEIVMFKAKEAWLLVCWLENFQGDAFHCDSVWTSKEVAYKLIVKPVRLNRESNKVYSMEAVAHGESGAASTWEEDFLLVPGGCKEHEITVSLI